MYILRRILARAERGRGLAHAARSLARPVGGVLVVLWAGEGEEGMVHGRGGTDGSLINIEKLGIILYTTTDKFSCMRMQGLSKWQNGIGPWL